jgi:hypothetical protein
MRLDLASVVYFIECAGYVKVGVTSGELATRVSELRVGCPFELTVLGSTPGDAALERAIHAELEADWVRGEWFRLCASTLAVIRRYIQPPVAATPAEVPVTSHVGSRVRLHLKRTNRRAGWLADAVGVSHPTMSQWLSGVRTPTTENLHRAAAALGLTMAEFYAEAA